MSDFFPSDPSPTANLQEVTVSELAGSIKRTIETNFDRVRVKGELGRVTIAKSGHMYADLKDDKAVINTIMWKGSVSRLPFRPEEGLEVVAEGKLSTYPGRSNYQLIADTMNPAGVGALMAMLEERKKKLAAEGLFAAEHKKPLPFLPQTIGVVTSPTGAVIRDILHRVRDRFPVRVLLWPALVQGEQAAAQISAGIKGFNALPLDGEVPRPDVLIVARGGGSIEDLWPFNEEIVVRAAFESDIPLISAVGHETDTTLIDYVSDQRAPTPTGAAEMALPVRTELSERLSELQQRLMRGLTQFTARQDAQLKALTARMPRPEGLFETREQRLDYVEGRLSSALQTSVLKKQSAYDRFGVRLRPEALKRQLHSLEREVEKSALALSAGTKRLVERCTLDFDNIERRLTSRMMSLKDVSRDESRINELAIRLKSSMATRLTRQEERIDRSASMLRALSYHSTLERGFVVVRDDAGNVVRNAETAAKLAELKLSFSDGDVLASPSGLKKQSSAATKPQKPVKGTDQGSLF